MFVTVKFNPWDTRTYTYAYDGDQSLKPGDLVTVDTPREGSKTVEVVSVDVPEPTFACKPITSVVIEGEV